VPLTVQFLRVGSIVEYGNLVSWPNVISGD